MLQTKNLVVIAGPSAVGKSTLLEKIQQNKLPYLSRQVGVEDPDSYLYLSPRTLVLLPQNYIENVVFHYDMLLHYGSRGCFPYLPGLISGSSNAIVLTLCIPNQLLINHISSRFDARFTSFIRRPNVIGIKRLRKYRNQKLFYKGKSNFGQASNLAELYGKWSESIEAYGAKNHLIVDPCSSDHVIAKPYKNSEMKNILHSSL